MHAEFHIDCVWLLIIIIGPEAKKAKLATGTGCVVEEKVPGRF
jgi:hypothetical protein